MKKMLSAVAACISLFLSCLTGFCQNDQSQSLDPTIVSDVVKADGLRYVRVQTCPKVCSRAIDIVITKKDVIKEVKFTRGCPGNTTGLCTLLEGMKVKTAIEKLEGTPCGKRGTSCPDQLARALKMIQKKPTK